MIDHDIDHIARMYRNRARGIEELVGGNQAFRFIAEVDDDVFGGYFENAALEYLTLGGRSVVAVVIEQIFIVLAIGQFWIIRQGSVMLHGHLPRLRTSPILWFRRHAPSETIKVDAEEARVSYPIFRPHEDRCA